MNFNVPVAETGEDMTDTLNAESLVIVNHQSTADVPTLFHSMQNKGQLVEKVMWIQDIIFKYSNFGRVSLVHKDFFIRQVGVLPVAVYFSFWLYTSIWPCM